MSQPAAIRAAFAEWRMVKSRKVLQLVFEVPLETQGEVLTMLGAPMPDAEIWCAIARLQTGAEIAKAQRDSNAAQSLLNNSASPPLAERPGVETGSSPTARARASERYHAGSPMEQARARAGILPSDLRFQQWVASQTNGVATEEHAAAFIREYCCGGGSRKSIAVEESCCWRFLAMETEYKIATQQMAEPR